MDIYVAAFSGAPRKDLMEKRISEGMEDLMERRSLHCYRRGDDKVAPCEGEGQYNISALFPIITQGDIAGSVAFISRDEGETCSETEHKLLQAAAGFLSKQMEN